MQTQMKLTVLFQALVLCLLTNVSVATTIDELVTGSFCPHKLKTQLAEWGVNGAVFETPISQGRGALYRLPTTEIGRWVLVSISKDRLRVSRVSDAGMDQVQWDDQCNLAITPTLVGFESTGPGFTDDDLKTLLAQHEMGVVYMWSPHMLLSVDGVNEVRDICDELGVSYTALLDPAADPDFAQRTGEHLNLPPEALQKAVSREMIFRDMFTHAPSLLFYRQGEIVGAVVPGYRNPEHYRITIQDRLKLADQK